MHQEPDMTPNPFDAAAKAALRDAALPAPPAWMDAQITAAARDQAQVAAGLRSGQQPRGVRAPWLKFALPTLAVATLLVSLWLPQTQVTQEGIVLPEAARVSTPTQAAVPVPETPPQPMAAEQAARTAPAAAIDNPAATPPANPAPARAPKPTASKPASAPRDAAPTTRAKERAEPQRASVASDAVQFASPAPPPAAPQVAPAAAPAPTVFAEAKAVQEQATPAASAERAADTKAAPSVLAVGAPHAARAQVSVINTAPAEQATQAPQARAAATMHRARSAQAVPSTQMELDSIRTLMREGKRDEAAKRLLALKEREPQLEIPVDLQDLLRRP